MKIEVKKIEEALSHVMDPEVDLDIWTMGLIYEIAPKDDGGVYILHTLTSPACPLGPEIQKGIRDAIMALGATQVDIEVTFDPPWQAPQELRDILGI